MTPEAQNIRDLLAGGRVEIRASRDGVWWAGVFNDYASLARSAKWAEINGFDVYATLNPTTLSVTNNIKPYRKATKDTDIGRIRRVPFDLDPERETGAAASEVQVGYARDRARVLVDFLGEFGWTDPIIGQSGNGYHVQYRCDLPNTAEVHALMVDLYRGLGVRMSTAEVAFDVTVKNPSRIFRLYGTTNRKSGRRSSLVWPDVDSLLDPGVFIETANTLKPPKPKPAPAQRKRVTGKGLRNFDVVSLFRDLGLYKRHLGGGKHAVTCIQCEKHSDQDHLNKTDTVIWEGEWPQYHCSHAHCDGVNIYDVLDRFA